MKISVVIPVYNESTILPELLSRLDDLDFGELIVVDGGSSDGTWERLTAAAGTDVQLLRSGRGRACQMNSGALRAGGDILLFLHADTRLPKGAAGLVEDGIARHPERCWGRFDVRFDHAGPLLRMVARAMNLRSAWTSVCTGDQAMFIRRREFLRLGGFATIPLMEDIELSRRLRRRSPAVRIREPATTSSRRWRAHGVWRTIGLMWWLRWLYWWGAPASTLAARYYGEP